MTRPRHPHPCIALHDSQRIPKIIFGDTRGLGKVRNLLSLSVEAVYDILRVVRGVIRCKSFLQGEFWLLGLSRFWPLGLGHRELKNHVLHAVWIFIIHYFFPGEFGMLCLLILFCFFLTTVISGDSFKEPRLFFNFLIVIHYFLDEFKMIYLVQTTAVNGNTFKRLRLFFVF